MAASDLHLIAGEPPVVRIDGRLQRTTFQPIQEPELTAMLHELMDMTQREAFTRGHDANFAVSFPGTERFRVNIHRQRGSVEAAFRRMAPRIPTLRELGIPPIAGELAMRQHGLVLVAGPVGMGKTTTLLAMVEQINAQTERLIISIEDPIEYLFTNKKSFIKQREVTVDTPSFADALRNALRQDPNVIVISEIRDYETIAIALTAAETGHLVLATMHAPDTAQAIQRIIDVFPATQQTQARLQLADSLQGVISQVLLPRATGHGRVPAIEMLIATPAVRNVIREQRIDLIYGLLETGIKDGMQTRDKSVSDLAEAGLITCDTATDIMLYPERFTCPDAAKFSAWAAQQAGIGR
jgi:twitching motility protein PilT